jgi:tRNA threonylcarbamoyladenosine biosynthesis protein TsaB
MLIFALDSTASLATVSLCRDQQQLAVYTLQNGNTHSETLLPMAQTLFERLSLTPADVDLFACTAGPGSFTGVRIGAATVKGLAFGTDKPCVGVSSLESLAYRLKDLEGIVCPLINARKFLYYALFVAHSGVLTRLCEDNIVELNGLQDAVATTLASATDAPVDLASASIYLVGDGYEIGHRLLSSYADRICPTPQSLRDQNAYDVAQLALQKHAQGIFCSDRELSPVYLRPCQAEREREERLQEEKNN